jgi:hypothetical protein
MKSFFLILLITLALFSCRKEDIPVQNENIELIGSWINPQYTDTLVTYTRSETLVENQYGITFENMGKLVQRQNSGWCGTPPITTADYEGTWIQKDSIVNITVGYWGGISTQKWKIVSLNNSKLTLQIIESIYQQGK